MLAFARSQLGVRFLAERAVTRVVVDLSEATPVACTARLGSVAALTLKAPSAVVASVDDLVVGAHPARNGAYLVNTEEFRFDVWRCSI